ncbi:hypothetical protein ABZP36_014272 [Zizania latifolia]
MRGKGHRLGAWMFDALMRACIKEGMHQEAIKLFNEMPGAEIEPDQCVYAVAIVALYKLRDADRSLLVLRKMDDAGFAPWDFTYNYVGDVLIKEGRMEEALHLKDEMLAAALTRGLCRSGDIDVLFGVTVELCKKRKRKCPLLHIPHLPSVPLAPTPSQRTTHTHALHSAPPEPRHRQRVGRTPLSPTSIAVARALFLLLCQPAQASPRSSLLSPTS